MLTFLVLIMLIVVVMRMLMVLPCRMRIIMITLAIIGLRCHGMVIGMSIGFVVAMGMQHDDHYGDEDAGGDNVDAAAIYISINAEYGNPNSTTTTMTRRYKHCKSYKKRILHYIETCTATMHALQQRMKQPSSNHLVQPIAWRCPDLGMTPKYDVCRNDVGAMDRVYPCRGVSTSFFFGARCQ